MRRRGAGGRGGCGGAREEGRREWEALGVPDPVGVVEAGYRLETLGDVWPQARAEERQQICRLMVREGYVDLGAGRIGRLGPGEGFLPLCRCHPRLEGDGEGGYQVKWPEGFTRAEEKPA